MKKTPFLRWLGKPWLEESFAGKRRSLRRRNRGPLQVEELESRTLPSITANLVANGSFEVADLAGEHQNLDGWVPFNLGTVQGTSPGSAGTWASQTGALSPLSLTTVPGPSSGRFEAMLDEEDLAPSFQGNVNNQDTPITYAGSHALYQDITIPSNATSLTLSFHLYIDDTGAPGYSNPNTTSTLNWNIPQANQQVRVDLMTPSDDILDVASAGSGGTVLQNLFQTAPGQPATQSLDLSFTLNVANYAGTTIRLRVGSANNQGKLLIGLDNVQMNATFADTTPPTVTGLQLRNPDFVSGPNNTPQTTDPTIVGQVGDDGSVNNVSFIEFDVNGDGFGGPDDVTVANFDASGRFSVLIPGLTKGAHTIPVEVVDKAGNVFTTNFTFIMQGPSITNWQAVGPGTINISSAGLDYKVVTGNVTSVVIDPTDPTGNTIYIGADNGGVWRTTDGGNDWVALTDNLFDKSGQRIAESIGAMAVGFIDQNGNSVPVVYAGTGVANTFTAPVGGSGILKSVNGGAFTLVGQSTFKGAHLSKIVVDPRNANTVYVAVSWWDDPSKNPGVFWSPDGGATWTDVLLPTNMYPAGLNGGTLGATTTLASVTDMVIDPFNPARVIIGMGNVGKVEGGPSSTAGVWLRLPDNPGVFRWVLQVGGDSKFIPNNTLPTGVALGKVSVAIGTGRVTDESTVYVLITDPPPDPNFTRGTFDGGASGSLSTVSGLYKTKDNFLNFTKVKLKELSPEFPFEPGKTPLQPIFENIGFSGRNAINTGTVLVDPANPNIVYVGGSDAYTQPGYPTDPPQHSLLRVDTGDMRDTTYQDPLVGFDIPNDGDDIQKAEQGELNWIILHNGAPDPLHLGDYIQDTKPGDVYNEMGQVYNDPTQGFNGVSFTGEGVYWYDMVQHGVDVTNTGSFMPSSFNQIAADPQGRLLFGTVNGIWRGVSQGFGYDFSSGVAFVGVLYKVQPFPIDPPAISFTSLNGNLQIADTTSVAVDPTAPNTYYMSEFYSGTARTQLATPSSWSTMGLTGPIDPLFGNLGVTNGVEVRTAAPFPTDKPGTLTTLFRSWQFLNPIALELDVSSDGGNSFTNTIKSGISINDNAGLNLPFALSPNPVVINGLDFHNLLFGTDRVYLTNTSTDAFDPISPILSGSGDVSALSFAPSAAGVYYAGTTDGKVFVGLANGTWVNRSGGLPTNGHINGVTVDANNANIAYAMITIVGKGVPTGGGVWKTTDGGNTWVHLTNGLPNVPAYSLVIDKRAIPGFLQGFLYVGTQIGVYQSSDLGKSWTVMGKGIPAAAVVDLQLIPKTNELAAALEGRGVFVLSTDKAGPTVLAVNPSTPVTSFSSVTVTFSGQIDPASFTLASIDSFTGPGGGQITPTSVVDITSPPAGQPNPHNVWQINFPAQTRIGVYSLTIGPNITNEAGAAMDQNLNGILGEVPGDEFTTRFVIDPGDDGQFVSGTFHDLLARTVSTQEFISNIGPIDQVRFSLLPAFGKGFVFSAEYFKDQVQAWYQKYLGRSADPSGLAGNIANLQAGFTDEQIIAGLVGGDEFFNKNGATNLSFLQAAYLDILGRPLDSSGQTAWLAALSSGVSRYTVALDLLESSEYRTKLVAGYYTTFLGRTGTSAEVSGWVTALGNGVRDEDVVNSFVSSVEYFVNPAFGGNANSTWVTSLYQNLLNRAPDPGGFNANLFGLLDGYAAQRQTEISSIVSGTEYRQDIVNAWYQKYLGRAADPGGLNSAVTALGNGFTDEQIIAGLVGSGEFFTKSGGTNTSFLQAAYQDILGRPIDSGAQAAWLTQLSAGVSRYTVALALLSSDEYRAKLVVGFYSSFLGRTLTPASPEIAPWINALASGVTDERVITAFLVSNEYFLRPHTYP